MRRAKLSTHVAVCLCLAWMIVREFLILHVVHLLISIIKFPITPAVPFLKRRMLNGMLNITNF